MKLADYVASRSDEAWSWPDGLATWTMLDIITHGLPPTGFRGNARSTLLSCYRLLRDLTLRSTDAELRLDAEDHLVAVARVLRNVHGLDAAAAERPVGQP
jgi:hypothetical protein